MARRAMYHGCSKARDACKVRIVHMSHSALSHDTMVQQYCGFCIHALGSEISCTKRIVCFHIVSEASGRHIKGLKTM